MTRPELMKAEALDLETLVGLAETLASQQADGHLTMLRFTTGWKVTLGTPDLDGGAGREEVSDLSAYPTLKEALVALLLNISLAAVNQLVRRGVVDSEVRYGKRLVSRASVLAYTPREKRGSARRQAKPKQSRKAGKKGGKR